MREFIKGWRRKAGCVTLLMACMLTSCWVRSLTRSDEIQLGHVFGQMYSVESSAGATCWLRWTGWVSFKKVRWQSYPHGRGGELSFQGLHRFSSEVNFGPDLSRVEETGIVPPDRRATGTGFMISYIYMVGPLTLLSAFLLLWKPTLKTGIEAERSPR
jgi:hypothetical protein